MSRLTMKLDEPIKTKYLNYEYNRIPDYDIVRGNFGRISDDMIFNKLGRLEDIEDELGCPLDIFVNIMLGKITEIVVNYSDAAGYNSLYEEFTLANVSGIIESCYNNCLCIETNLCDVPIKDYKVNWFLKGDLSE